MALVFTSVPLSSRLSEPSSPFSRLSEPSSPFSMLSDRPSSILMGEPSKQAKMHVDWVEKADAHVFKADLPGLGNDDIKVALEGGGILQISGERKSEETQKGDKWHRAERSHGGFMRKFKLPESVDVDGIKAEAANGVLTVCVPKLSKPEASTKTVQVL